MNEAVEISGKKKSGCVKWLGCGCLVLILIGAGMGGVLWFFSSKIEAPGKARAEHMVPANAMGHFQVNLHQEDEGLTDLHRYIMQEMQTLQAEDSSQGWAGMVQQFMGKRSTDAATAVGPQISGWFGMASPESGERPWGVIADLNTLNRITASAIQFTLSAMLGAERTAQDYKGVDLLVDPDAVSFAVHKGFVLLSKNENGLKQSIDQFQASRESDWPMEEAFDPVQDMDLHWTGDFSGLNQTATHLLQLPPPGDSDYVSPSKGLESIRMFADVQSADRIQFNITAEAASRADAERIRSDLDQHARELSAQLAEQDLSLEWTTDTQQKSAVLTLDLSGLKAWISGWIQERFAPATAQAP